MTKEFFYPQGLAEAQVWEMVHEIQAASVVLSVLVYGAVVILFWLLGRAVSKRFKDDNLRFSARIFLGVSLGTSLFVATFVASFHVPSWAEFPRWTVHDRPMYSFGMPFHWRIESRQGPRFSLDAIFLNWFFWMALTTVPVFSQRNLLGRILLEDPPEERTPV